MEKREKVEQAGRMARAIRKDILTMTYDAGAAGAHVGGALSCADALAVLYGGAMQVSPERAEHPCRDRFILSKGHSSVGWYAALHQRGFLTEEEIQSFEKNGDFLPAHSVINLKKGIELSSGSLGLGLSFGIGEALNAKRKGLSYKVYVLMGNGECNEGCVWEAVMLAAKLGLDNLFMIVDDNKQQLDGESEEILGIKDLEKKLGKFGFESYRVNGRCVRDLVEIFEKAGGRGMPVAVVMDTIKGKGVSFMENNPAWHHNHLTEQEYEQAIREVEADG